MTRARRRALLLALILACGAAVAVAIRSRSVATVGQAHGAKRPTLLVLTSLPLLFGEDFSLAGGGSAAMKALQSRYRMVPISATSERELAKGGLLLMAQPQAQPPENLVALDNWVRRGGRLLLLADPMLEWPSKLPIGDRTRPPLMFVDTGLLAHWGLRLDTPEERGPAERKLGGFNALTVSPGALYGRCPISADRLVARCRLERGDATIIADADLLNVGGLGSSAEHNLDGVVAELASLSDS